MVRGGETVKSTESLQFNSAGCRYMVTCGVSLWTRRSRHPLACGGRIFVPSLRGVGSFHSATLPFRIQAGAAKAGTASTAVQRPPIYDGWEIDEELRHFGRVLDSGPVTRERFGQPAAQPEFRLDAGHGAGPARETSPTVVKEDGAGCDRSQGACPGRSPAGRHGLDGLVIGHDGFRVRPGFDRLVGEHAESGSVGRRRRPSWPGRSS